MAACTRCNGRKAIPRGRYWVDCYACVPEPPPFVGPPTPFETHLFTGIDGRCMRCDAKPWHGAASRPCS